MAQPISLDKILRAFHPLKAVGATDCPLSGLCYDSRRVQAGNVFFALRGDKMDGNRYIAAAIERGAVAVVTDVAGVSVPAAVALIEVREARQALALAAAEFYDHPTQSLRLAGITGTNGKTTTAYLVHSILETAHGNAGLLGTVEYRIGGRTIEAKNTTPESLDLQGYFAELRDHGCRFAVMEVSSHALEMHRVEGCRFSVGVFTNLTQDHLDYHQTMDRYFAAKKKLFDGTGSPPPEWAVLNVDDARGAQLNAELRLKKINYGWRESAAVHPASIDYSFDGLKMTVVTPRGTLAVESILVGQPNAYNLLAAVATAIAMDIDMQTIEQGIRNLRSVPGRFDKVNCGQPFAVVVDYAHTDDALNNVIKAARQLTQHRVITVFGCGGDRDRKKRPKMGEVAGQLSDFTVLTSDNPRTEDPLRIIADAVVGLQRTSKSYAVEPDRYKAIRRALEEAREGDIVLLTGKGHETYQVVGDEKYPFDDREVAREILAQLGYQPTVCN